MTEIPDAFFLEDFVGFGAWVPTISSAWLLQSQPKDEPVRQAVALQLFMNMQTSLECLAMWYFALRDWRPGQESLVRRYSKIFIEEGADKEFTTARAIEELTAPVDVSALLSRLHQPSSAELRVRGWVEEQITAREASAADLLDKLRIVLSNRHGTRGDFVNVLNRLKHGMLVIQDPRHQGRRLEGDLTEGMLTAAKVSPLSADACEWDLSEHQAGTERLKDYVQIMVVSSQIMTSLLAILGWFYQSDLQWSSLMIRYPQFFDRMNEMNRLAKEFQESA